MVTPGARLRSLREAVHSAAETLRIGEVGDEPLAHLGRAVGASGILLYRYDDRGVVGGHGGTIMHALPSYVVELYAEDPIQHALLSLPAMPDVVVATRLRTFDVRRYHRSAAYVDFYARHDMEHLLGAGLSGGRYGAPGMTGVLMTRARSEAPFDDDDLEILREALPAFQAAIRRSDRLAREERARATAAMMSASTSAPTDPAALAQAASATLAARHGLTGAEAEVLALVARGLSNREIAAARHVSVETVRTHVQRLLGKLGVPSRAQAAARVHCVG